MTPIHQPSGDAPKLPGTAPAFDELVPPLPADYSPDRKAHAMTASERPAPPRHIAPGQRWLLVWPDGREVEYIVEMAEAQNSPGAQELRHYVKLLNPQTGGYAWQSISTLRGIWKCDPTHWVYAGEVEERVAA